MPCQYCQKEYNVKPCESNEQLQWYSIYPRLQTSCPCIDCLVKIACYEGRYKCETWLNFLRPDRAKTNAMLFLC